MKSKYFTKYNLEKSEIESVKKIIELSPEQLKRIIDFINQITIGPRRIDDLVNRDTVRHANSLCEECSLSFEELQNITSFTLTTIKLIHNNDDSVNDFADDLIKRNYLKSEEKQKLVSYLNSNYEKGKELALIQRRTAYESGELSILSSIDYDVDLRLLPKRTFDHSEINIEDYKPSIEALFPIAIVGLRLENSVRNEAFSFQVNFNELEDLIVNLQACQKEMRLLEKISKTIKIPEKI
jgi:hypothetical protein